MTINIADNDPRVSYSVAAGVTQSSFVVDFAFYDEADLNVYVDETLKTLTSDYTVTGGNGSAGTVAISVTGAAGGSTVVITRSIPLERTTDFPISGAFNIASLNTELDRIVAITADLKDDVDRALKLVDYDSGVNTQVPLLDARKGTVLGFNLTTGVPEAGPQISDVQSLADITADIARLADIEDGTDATNAIQTVAGISSDVTEVNSNLSNITAVADNSSNINSVVGNSTNINTVAGSISNVNAVGNSISNVNTIATNISDINNFSDIYRVQSSDPTTNLDQGDLVYNTNEDILKYYNGASWVSIANSIGVRDDGVALPSASRFLNFKGTGVSVSESPGLIADITITDTTYPLSTFANDGLMSGADNLKLYFMEEEAQKNVPAFRTIQVSGYNNVVAGGPEDILTFEAGSHIQIWTTDSQKKVSIRSTLIDATTSTAGLMSTSDKAKINGIDVNANNYSLPTASASVLGGIKIGAGLSIDGSGVVTSSGSGGISSVLDDTTPQLGGNLDVNGNDIVSTSNGAIDLDPNGSGKVTFKGNATRGSGQFVLNCEQNSHGITIKGPPHSAAANYTLVLPNNDGTSGQALTTDGSGNLSFSTVSGSGGMSNVVEDTTPQLGGNLDLNSNNITGTGDITLTGDIKPTTYQETVGTESSGTLDLSTGNVFSHAPSANTTYVFSNPPSTGTAFGFTLKVSPSAAITQTWPSSVDWAGGSAPTATASGETDVFVFYTQDGGTTYYGFQAGNAMA